MTSPVSTLHGVMPSLGTPDAEDRALLRRVVDYYHETLQESAEAIAYLEKRGINSVDAIDHFQLGFSNRTLGYRLPKKVLKAGAEVRGRLQRLGVLRASGHEHMSGSITIPILDASGDVTGLYGRKITPALREGTPLHLYLPGPHRGVWNEPALAESKEIILCEALLDALTFWCGGYRNVITSYGIEGFTADHRAALVRHGTERVLIAYDRDDAGDHAATTLADELQGEGIECYRILFPPGMDANAYAVRSAAGAKALGDRIRSAVWLGRRRAAPDTTSAGPPSEQQQTLSVGVSGGGNTLANRETPSAPDPGILSSLAAESPPTHPIVSPVPASAAPPLPVEVREHEVILTVGERSYRVRGLERNHTSDVLKLNLLVRQGDAVHVDTLDLYAARQRAAFIKQAAAELGTDEETLAKEVGRVLLELETLRDRAILKALEPVSREVQLTEKQRADALALLRAPDLAERVVRDLDRIGLVGETANKLVAYLAAVSRKLERPLAIVVQSASAAGKTSLMDAVLSFVPEEERTEYSAMTGQSLFYMGEKDLRHKVLSVVEEEGAERASYALKLLQSEGTLTIASTGKDPHTGRLVTHEYRVDGPVAIFLTTTAVEIDEELQLAERILIVGIGLGSVATGIGECPP